MGSDKTQSLRPKDWRPILFAMACCLTSVDVIAACPTTGANTTSRGYHINELIKPKNIVSAVSWSSDGRQLAVLVGWDAQILDTQSWITLRSFQVAQRPLFFGSPALLLDRILLVGGDISSQMFPPGPHAMTEWDIDTGTEIRFLPFPAKEQPDAYRPQDIFTASLDHSTVASIDLEGHVLNIFDLSSGSQRAMIDAPKAPRPVPMFQPMPNPNPLITDRFRAVAFAPDNHRVAACMSSGRLYLVDVEAAALLDSTPVFPEGVNCTAVAFNADNRLVAAGREAAHDKPLGRQPRSDDKIELEDQVQNVRIIDSMSYEGVFTIQTAPRSTVRDLAWNQGGCDLAVADDTSLSIWRRGNSDTFTLLNSFKWPSRRIAFSPDNRLAVVSGDDLLILEADDHR